MNEYRPPSFSLFPPVVKNLLVANVMCYLATVVLLKTNHIDITQYFGLHYFQSSDFKIYQLVTYLFLHDPTSIFHILFNMFALWMFGNAVENYWGAKRFLLFYFVCGIGAGLTQELVQYIYYHHVHQVLEIFSAAPNQSDFSAIASKYFGVQVGDWPQNEWIPSLQRALTDAMNQSITIGASGAIFGVLLAFGMIFPNTELFIMFIPIPVKAKYVIVGYTLLELYTGIKNSAGDNVAHFAHLGGMVFGLFLILYWRRKRST